MTAAILVLAILAGSVPQTDPGTILLGGKATHYCLPGQRGTSYCTRGYGPEDMVAAIDRKDTPWNKGDRLRVSSGGRSVVVLVVDVCGCPGRRIIDLTSGAFRRLAPLGRGVIPVTITDAAAIPLPATDTVQRPRQETHR
jgi:hypothetical protein